jgi:hypothetical protein
LETGTVVALQVPKEFGKFRIQKAIGAGARSAAVQAIDVLRGRAYAMKIVSVEDLARHSLLKQFEDGKTFGRKPSNQNRRTMR